MENPVTDPLYISIEHFWKLISSIDAMLALQTLFLIIFTVVLFSIFAKGIKDVNLGDLFRTEITNTTSHTKFWGNVSYFAATVSFLAINLLFFREFQQNIEIIWLIYLSVVSGNNIASKWISYKYNTGSGGGSQPPEPERST